MATWHLFRCNSFPFFGLAAFSKCGVCKEKYVDVVMFRSVMVVKSCKTHSQVKLMLINPKTSILLLFVKFTHPTFPCFEITPTYFCLHGKQLPPCCFSKWSLDPWTFDHPCLSNCLWLPQMQLIRLSLMPVYLTNRGSTAEYFLVQVIR